MADSKGVLHPDLSGLESYWTTDLDHYLILRKRIEHDGRKVVSLGLARKDTDGTFTGPILIASDFISDSKAYTWGYVIHRMLQKGCQLIDLDDPSPDERARYRDLPWPPLLPARELQSRSDYDPRFYCPVCGTNYFPYMPWGIDGDSPTYDICSDCCGVEWGADDIHWGDEAATLENIHRLRAAWIKEREWSDGGRGCNGLTMEDQLKQIPPRFR
jgi:hypothetical protein